jgi:ribonuclease HI
VGDGTSIKVRGDCWLPTPISYSVQSPCINLQEDILVAELIDQESGRWKCSLIEASFSKEEAEVILNIPLSPCLPKDRLIWRGTKNGIFTVRSAYHLEVEEQSREKGASSSPGEEERIWKECWNLNIPNAAKMFLWRAGHNLLPTKMNLMQRRVVKDSYCPICLREPETVEHALWECLAAADVWSCGPVRLQKSKVHGGSFIHLFEDIWRRCNKYELELFVITARRIWLRRNTIVHGGEMTHPLQVTREATTSLDDYQRANAHMSTEDEAGGNIVEKRWAPPRGFSLKINFDAALDVRNRVVGLGIVARDEGGRVKGACSVTLKVSASPVEAEALAALQAVIFAQKKAYSGVIFEGDAQTIVNAVNSLQPNESSYGHFIEDAKRGLVCLGNSKFVHVHREANIAAHTLARAACNHATGIIWWHCSPSCLDGVVRKEALFLSS